MIDSRAYPPQKKVRTLFQLRLKLLCLEQLQHCSWAPCRAASSILQRQCCHHCKQHVGGLLLQHVWGAASCSLDTRHQFLQQLQQFSEGCRLQWLL